MCDERRETREELQELPSDSESSDDESNDDDAWAPMFTRRSSVECLLLGRLVIDRHDDFIDKKWTAGRASVRSAYSKANAGPGNRGRSSESRVAPVTRTARADR